MVFLFIFLEKVNALFFRGVDDGCQVDIPEF